MKILTVVLSTITVLLQLCAASYGGGVRGASGPQLDATLMGMKEHGAWYFLCEAPMFPYRIPPHYQTYGPPPPPYCPPPCVIPPRKASRHR
jgi:hypothetical protein